MNHFLKFESNIIYELDKDAAEAYYINQLEIYSTSNIVLNKKIELLKMPFNPFTTFVKSWSMSKFQKKASNRNNHSKRGVKTLHLKSVFLKTQKIKQLKKVCD